MLAGAPPFNCPHASDCKYRTLVNDRATYWRYHEMHAAGAAGATLHEERSAFAAV